MIAAGVPVPQPVLTTTDEVLLASRRWLAPTPRAAVVLVHGFSASSEDPKVLALAEQLHADDLDVVCYDARGHGRSEGLSSLGDLERHEPEGIARGTRTPPADAAVGERRALVHGLRRPQRVRVYRREALRARNVLQGPAIVEQMDSTVVIGRGHRAAVDEEGNLWLRAAR